MLAFFLLIQYNDKAVDVSATKNATVAQSVEQLIRNQQVAGSSPASSSKKTLMQKSCISVFFYPFCTSALKIPTVLFLVGNCDFYRKTEKKGI